MTRFLRWLRSGENRVTGNCFDIGVTTSTALRHFERTGETAENRPDDAGGAGNGSLMRLAPVAIFASLSGQEAARLAICTAARRMDLHLPTTRAVSSPKYWYKCWPPEK